MKVNNGKYIEGKDWMKGSFGQQDSSYFGLSDNSYFGLQEQDGSYFGIIDKKVSTLLITVLIKIIFSVYSTYT